MSSRSVDGLQRRSGSKNKSNLAPTSQDVFVRQEIKTIDSFSQGVNRSQGSSQNMPLAAPRKSIIVPSKPTRVVQPEISPATKLTTKPATKPTRKVVKKVVKSSQLDELSSTKPHRQIGIPESKKAQRQMIREHTSATNEALYQPSEPSEDSFDSEAAKQFLEDTQDMNATDFDHVPAKDKKSWKKEQKRAAKEAKRDVKKHKKKSKKKKVIAWIIVIFLLIILGAGIFVYFRLDDTFRKATGGGGLIDFLVANDKDPLVQDEKGRTNFLVFGTEGYDMDDPNYDGGHLTDSMMLVSLDQNSGDVKAVSLPRDLHYGTCTGTGKLNEVYYCKYDADPNDWLDKEDSENVKRHEKSGQDALAEAFSDILGVDIHYKIHANWAALQQIVDALGGIDVVFISEGEKWDGPETAIETSDPRGLADANGKGGYHFQFGSHEVLHLNGEQALAVSRARNHSGGYGAIRGNFSREYFQQKIIEASVKKLRQTNLITDIGAVNSLLDAVGDNLRTTFEAKEIKILLRLAGEVDIANMESISLYENYNGEAAMMTTGTVNGISYVLPTAGDQNYTRIHKFIDKHLYMEKFAAEEAEVVILNASGTPGLASDEQEKLEGLGFTISEIGNTPEDFETFDGKKIYKLNDEMTGTAQKLEEIYKIKPKSEDLPEGLEDYKDSDFVIILGD